MVHEPTTLDILEAIQEFSSSVDGRMGRFEERMDRMEGKIDQLEGQMDRIEERVGNIETKMVTKNYLDEKIDELRGDLTLTARKGNTKLTVLIEDLEYRKVIDHETARRILALEPFPSTNL